VCRRVPRLELGVPPNPRLVPGAECRPPASTRPRSLPCRFQLSAFGSNELLVPTERGQARAERPRCHTSPAAKPEACDNREEDPRDAISPPVDMDVPGLDE
jgi:hypothetical protein